MECNKYSGCKGPFIQKKKKQVNSIATGGTDGTHLEGLEPHPRREFHSLSSNMRDGLISPNGGNLFEP